MLLSASLKLLVYSRIAKSYLVYIAATCLSNTREIGRVMPYTWGIEGNTEHGIFLAANGISLTRALYNYVEMS